MSDMDTYIDYVRAKFYPDKSQSELTPAEKARVESEANNLFSKYNTNINGLQLWEVCNNGSYNQLVNRQTYVGQYMTDPQFFSRMIDYGASYAPADKYDLIIWDHGGGYLGYGADDILWEYKEAHPEQQGLPDSTFSLEQIRQSLTGSSFIQNGGRFDLIGSSPFSLFSSL